jgi:hypothetical protein
MRTGELLLAGVLVIAPLAVSAHSWHDDEGYGHRHHREYKEKYWDGHCKVKRMYKRNGDFKEQRKCRAPEYRYYERYYDREPVYRSRGGATIIIDPIRIQGF